MNYKKMFEDLQKPKHSDEYQIESIDKDERIFIAKNGEDRIGVIVNYPNWEGEWPQPRRTPSLHFISNQNSKLKSGNQNREAIIAGIILLEDEILNPFCVFLESLIKNEEIIDDPNLLWEFLEDFHKCFSDKRRDISRDKAIGLWGELHFILEGDVDSLFACWKGPERYIFDFAGEELAVDVKTTTASTRMHRVKLEQVKPRKDIETFLFSLKIKHSYSDGKSVDDYIKELCEKMGNRALDVLIKLREWGYVSQGAHVECTKKYNLQDEAEAYFNVTDIPQLKNEGLPECIENIEFDIILTNIPKLENRKIKYIADSLVASGR